jgi:putative ABC transport system permease protein
MFVQITAYLNNAPGSIVVAQDGVTNLLGATSVLPGGASAAVKAEGAESAVPILSTFIILDLHEKKQPAYLIGYEPKMGGGPWSLAGGREPRTDREVVFDSILAQRHKVVLGETLEILDRDLTVVGFSKGTNSWMTSFIFVRKRAAENLLRAPDATSFLLVQPRARTSDDELAARLQTLSGIEVLGKSEVMANDVKLFGKFFSAPLQLMVAIAFLVGVLVVGLVIYTATVERQREYGVLKALGARNRTLYRILTAQALVATGAGSILGAAASFGTAQLIMMLYPQFLVVIEPRGVLESFLAGLGIALLAALFPARVVARLAPAEVFRAQP